MPHHHEHSRGGIVFSARLDWPLNFKVSSLFKKTDIANRCQVHVRVVPTTKVLWRVGAQLARDRACAGAGRTNGGGHHHHLVPLHVQCQVVRAGEAPFTVLALEWLTAGVLAVMAGQLVRASESPLAALPRALVGLFTCVGPLVCFQVRRLCVDLFAAVEEALVDASLAVGRHRRDRRSQGSAR